jgi:FlaA1/EpsC-like NDP-sugar epimerase
MIRRRTVRAIGVFAIDVALAALSFLLSLYLRLGGELLIWPRDAVVGGLVMFTAVAAAVFLWARLDQIVWRYVALGDLGRIVRAVALTLLAFLAAQFLYNRLDDFPRSFLAIEFFVLTALLAGPRFTYRFLRDRELSALLERDTHRRVPVLLVGAGDGTDLFIREMSRGREVPFRVVGIIDERGRRIGSRIRGVPILGGLEETGGILERMRDDGTPVERLIVTRKAIDGADIARLIEIAEAHGATVSRLPTLTELGNAGGERVLTPRPIAVEDLLGRPRTVLDETPVINLIRGRRVLVTGAGGSIGSEIARQVAALAPAEVALLDSSEFHLYQIDLDLAERAPDTPRRAILSDVRDRHAVGAAIKDMRPDVVLHAAALKHVPLVESNPAEGVLTNVIGTRNVADACVAAGVSTMVLISTDKAVNPSSVMGATKRLAESYCQALDVADHRDDHRGDKTRFVTVRFGNVLGSTGSVIPLFQRQLARGGPLTVTHPEMKRYFMTVREAVGLVLHAAAMDDAATAKGGAICVLEMGEPVRIVDLARQMIRLSGLEPERDVEIVFTGIRPGEKLFEELFYDAEALAETSVPGVRVASPRAVEPQVLARAIDELETACANRREDEALRLLSSLVPEATLGVGGDAAASRG